MLLLQNAFTEFQQTTYGAGVNSGIAAFAQTLRTALPANELDGLAQRIGGGFRTIAVAVAALGSVALQHVDGILRFGGALASFLALQSVASILSRLSPSFLLLGASAALAASADPKFRTLAVGVGVLTAGFVALNAELAATLARVLIIPAAATAGLLVVGEGLKKIGVPGFGFDDFKKVVGAAADALDIGGILKKLNDDINGALSAGASNLSGLPGVKEITDAFAEASKAADAFAAKQADLGSQYDANAARAARAAALQADADALTTKQQSLLDRADPIGKATRAYREQLDLLHQLVAAKQISADQERAIAGRLAASTLAERDPFAALVKSMREEADVLALTGDSREVENKLLQQKNDLLKAGVDLTADQIAALRQLDAAMLDMQHGGSNGFAQWSASAKDFKTSINDAEKNGVEGLSNALADVVTKGKADFASLAQSILHDLAKAVIQSWLKDALAGFGGGAASLTAALANASRVSAATPPVGIVPNAISTPVVNVYAGSVAFAGGIGSDFAAAANSAGVTKMIPGSYPIVPSGSFSGSFMDAFPALNAASNLTGANGRLNPAAAFSYLRSAGLSDVAASAVLGNLKQESSFNPNIWGDGGSSFGLGQWNGDRLASLRGFAGSTTPDAKSQLDFLLSELRGSESRAGSALFGANDLSSANSAMKMFERYGDASQGTRLSFSQDIFNQFSQSTGQLTGAMTAAANAAQLSAGGMGSLASTLTQSAIPALSQIGAGMIGGGGGGLSSWLATLPAFDTGGLTKGAGPAMLHDNEAVVPLTRGGAIPVEGGRNGGSGRAIINMPITIMATDAASFGRSQKQIGRKLQERVHRAAYE
ncbi:MAG: phage tail tip lysozyme [Bauldia sp.]